MYSENSNTFVRHKPSHMNAAVTQQVLAISAPGLEDINSAANPLCFWCLLCIFAWGSISQTVRNQTGRRTQKDRILYKRNKDKLSGVKHCFFLISSIGKLPFLSPKLSFSPRRTVPEHLMSTRGNVFPRKCVTPRKCQQFGVRRHFFGWTSPPRCSGLDLSLPGDPDAELVGDQQGRG